MAHAGFVHLKSCSTYSLLHSSLEIDTLARLGREHRMPALALTDQNNLFGALEFTEACTAHQVQPIIGCQLRCHLNKFNGTSGFLTFLVQNQEGYENLLHICSQFYLQKNDFASVSLNLHDDVCPHSGGLILLSGGNGGLLEEALHHSSDKTKLEKLIVDVKQAFPSRFYLEIQRETTSPKSSRHDHHLVALARAFQLPLVATNECLFPKAEDYEIQQVLTCISRGEKFTGTALPNAGKSTDYFRSAAEMKALFSDLPDAIENTVLIAQRCAFGVPRHKPCLPKFQTANEDVTLRQQATAGLAALQRKHRILSAAADDYTARLEHELNVITEVGYSGYFLIVADFVRYAKDQDIAVGPGRGSGAGSLVAWALGITEIDPIRFKLIFERFLNPARVSLPDFDIDFCQEKRDAIITYLQKKYGYDRVAQIITFGTMQPRAAVRDVSRVKGVPYHLADRICKLMPYNPNKIMSIAETLASEPQLRQLAASDNRIREMLAIAQRIEGTYRHASTHAAGVVIANQPITRLVALYRDKDAPHFTCPTTQAHMKTLEKSGLVKFDLLGLKTLTIIDKTLKMAARSTTTPIPHINDIPLDDPPIFNLFCNAATVAVFQFESSGMRALLRDAKPSNIDDLVALVALYRPGPMENIPTYLSSKSGREKPESLHPDIDEIVKSTYGVIIYQEQVMQIAQKIANYSPSQADLLRRAMGKKIHEEMQSQKKVFIQGATNNQISAERAEKIFDLMAKFASYGFNKAHATCYALLAYQTAWCKVHYPAEFLAACMSEDIDNKTRLNLLVDEALALGVQVLPPDINRSDDHFLVEHDPNSGKKVIYYALPALKSIGQNLAKTILATRRAEGSFQDIFDFLEKAGLMKLTCKQLLGLAASGALDTLAPSHDRGQIYRYIETAYDGGNGGQDTRQKLLLGLAVPPQEQLLTKQQPFSPREKCAKELETFGFFLTERPLTYLQSVVRAVKDLSVQEPEGSIISPLTVVSKETRMNNRGERFAAVLALAPSRPLLINLWQEKIAAYNDIFKTGSLVLARLQVPNQRQSDNRYNLLQATPLDHWLYEEMKTLVIKIETPNATTLMTTLENILLNLNPNKVANQQAAHVKITMSHHQDPLTYQTVLPFSYQLHSEIIQELEQMKEVSGVKCFFKSNVFKCGESQIKG